MARMMNGRIAHSAGDHMPDGTIIGGMPMAGAMWMMWLTWLVMLVLTALFVYLIVVALRGRGGNRPSAA